MASLKAIRKRIGSVKNTQKVTKAMKMIAAARLRRAQIAALGARFYAAHVREIAVRIAERSGVITHPFLTSEQRERVGGAQQALPVGGATRAPVTEYLAITSDRGLCGGFNENLLRRIAERCKTSAQEGKNVHVTIVGRKGRDYFRAKGLTARNAHIGFYEGLGMAKVLPLAEGLGARFLQGEIHRLVLVYNRFRSAIAQDITFEELLPMAPIGGEARYTVDYLYEPARPIVVDRLLTRALGARIYQALLESVASEFAARMTAMDSATKNASDMIQLLTTQLNRARQASITKDLMDIVNGAESLKKS